MQIKITFNLEYQKPELFGWRYKTQPICDVCKKEITEEKEGNLEVNEDTGDSRIVHKEECGYIDKDKYPCWTDLSNILHKRQEEDEG